MVFAMVSAMLELALIEVLLCNAVNAFLVRLLTYVRQQMSFNPK